MIEVVVSGARGRLGQRIAERVREAEDMRLVGVVVRPGTGEGADLGTLSGRLPIGLIASSELTPTLHPGRVLVETAPRKIALDHAACAAKAGCPILIATTGFTPAEQGELRALAERVPLLLAPNLSPGVAVLADLVARASALLKDYELEILEIHHDKKRDAPSGTALALGQVAAEARGQELERDAILARAGETGPRSSHEIGLQALRGGDTVGEHTVYLFGSGERLELTHRAHHRDVFADGAVRAARFLGAPGRTPRFYKMTEVLRG